MATHPFVARLIARAKGSLLVFGAAALLAGGAGPADAARRGTSRRASMASAAGGYGSEADIQFALDAQLDAIQQCARPAMHASPSPFDVSAQLMVNNFGQVLGCEVSVGLRGSDGDELRSCVQGVLRKTSFPRTTAPLIQLSRSWTFNAR